MENKPDRSFFGEKLPGPAPNIARVIGAIYVGAILAISRGAEWALWLLLYSTIPVLVAGSYFGGWLQDWLKKRKR